MLATVCRTSSHHRSMGRLTRRIKYAMYAKGLTVSTYSVMRGRAILSQVLLLGKTDNASQVTSLEQLVNAKNEKLGRIWCQSKT